MSIVKPTRRTIFRVYWISLYMFRTVFPSIIRSPRLYIQRQVYVIEFRWLHASGHVPVSMQSTKLSDIHLTLYVQSWTPDDGRKDRPKHVEWYSINSKIVRFVGFTIEIEKCLCVCIGRPLFFTSAESMPDWDRMQCACSVLSSTACPRSVFSTLSHKLHEFQKNTYGISKVCFDFL
jgi:hypothetical protein